MFSALMQAGSRTAAVKTPPLGNATIRTLPPPPQPPDNPQTESERQQQVAYETWLAKQNNIIASQQRYFETEITKLRKQRKSLNSRQRTLKKNGQELAEHDAADLDRIQKEAATIQRQLDQCRKSARQHSMLTQEYANKRNRQVAMMPSQAGSTMPVPQQSVVSGTSPLGPGQPGSSPMHSTPQSPLMSPSPSSQPGMGLSPMVHSPHTPVASPNPTAVPQHSPHGMGVPGSHPSPSDHTSPFSPQARMTSPGGPTNYPGPQQMGHHPMMVPQGMRVRMPVHSPGNQVVQPGQMSPHMMVVRQNYSQPGPMMNQVQTSQMMMRPQFHQGVMPLRRPSGSGPVPSPGSVGSCVSPAGPSPSPGMSMKPSPVHSGLKSPVPLASPQMRPHSVENPRTPLTPGSMEMAGAPQTPHSDHGSQVNSPHHSIPTPTPPSPAALGQLHGLSDSNGGGGGGNSNAIPAPPNILRFGFFKKGLRGGAPTVRSRWGHFKIGLKGGIPLGEEATTESQSPSVSTNITNTTTSISSTPPSSEINTNTNTQSSTSITPTSDSVIDDEGLASVLIESVKGPIVHLPMTSNPISSSAPSSYSSPIIPQFSGSGEKVVVPEPPKSEIPPSSRHQAVIGIPGGGVIHSQSSIFPPNSVGVAPGIVLPMSAQSNYSSHDSNSTASLMTGHYTNTSLSNSGITSSGNVSLSTTPIMSITQSTFATSKVDSEPITTGICTVSAPDDVSVISSIVNVNDQVGNVIASNSSVAPTNPIQTSAATLTTAALQRPLASLPQQQHVFRQQSIQNRVPSTVGQQMITTSTNQQNPVVVQQQVVNGQQVVTTQQVIGSQVASHQMIHLPGMQIARPQQVQLVQASQQTLGQYGIQQHGGNQVVVRHQPGTVVGTASGGMVVTGTGAAQVGMRMVGQQVVVPQGLVRANGVVVGPSGQVQSSVRMMMIHGGQRTPSPPVSRQTSPMMPPPAAKSPASHAASPISRESPALSPISNHPSPHSPQVKGQSPLLGSPSPGPHGTIPTPPNVLNIKKENDEEMQPTQTTNFQLITTASSSFAGSIPVQSQAGAGDISKDTPVPPNALLKQLLQNAGCASTPLSTSGQLVLVRSSQGSIQVQPSHLGQQIPNSSQVKPLPSVTSGGLLVSTPHSQSNLQTLHQPVNGPQVSRPAIVQHRPVAVTSSPHPSHQYPSSTQVLVAHQPSTHGVTHQTIVNQGSHIHANQQVIPQTVQHTAVRQIVNHHPGKPTAVHAPPGHHIVTNQAGQHQAVAVTQSSSHPSLPNHHVVIHPGSHPGFRPGQHPVIATVHQSNKPQVVSGTHPALSTQPNNQLTSMADRLSNNPGLKTAMSVVIPESVGTSSGPSTGGDHTPEMNTPNESSDPNDPEEIKRAKKRAQNQARRKSQSKDAKVQPAKRPRQGSRVEEDYDTYIESMMAQLRSMPPLTIMEPDVPRNFNVCTIYGSGEVAKLGRKDHDHRRGVLEGQEGAMIVKNMMDYYDTQPFGNKLPVITPMKSGPPKGFYNQEFTPPKIGLPLDDHLSDCDISTGLSRPTSAATREADSPDTVLTSSSPECVMPESPPPFRGLRLIDMDEDSLDDHRDRSLSPVIPVLTPIPIRPNGPSWKQEDKKLNDFDDKENCPEYFSSITLKSKVGLTPAFPLKDMGNVTVTMTLSSQAGEDVANVLRNLANLLNIAPPMNYKVDHFFNKSAQIQKLYKHKYSKTGKEQVVDVQSIINGKIRFCKQCDAIVTNNFVCKKANELGFLSREEKENMDDIVFCNKQCYIQYAFAHKAVVDDFLSDDVASANKNKDYLMNEDTKDSGSVISEDTLGDWSKEEGLEEVLKLPQMDDDRKPTKHKIELDDDYSKHTSGKRFKEQKFKYFISSSGVLPDKLEKPTDKEITDLLFRMSITYRKSRLPDDPRKCSLCHLYGDYLADGPSRLLNYDVNKWVHLNCALWADDVYETLSGSLMKVEPMMKRVLGVNCEHCTQGGASVKCFKVRCSKVYHLNCAVKEGCTFYKDKTVLCPEHVNKGEKDNELSSLGVCRRVFIDRDENRQVASVMHHADMSPVLRIGSLILVQIGQLLPHQLQAFHTPSAIYPIGYQVVSFIVIFKYFFE